MVIRVCLNVGRLLPPISLSSVILIYFFLVLRRNSAIRHYFSLSTAYHAESVASGTNIMKAEVRCTSCTSLLFYMGTNLCFFSFFLILCIDGGRIVISYRYVILRCGRWRLTRGHRCNVVIIHVVQIFMFILGRTFSWGIEVSCPGNNTICA